MKVDVANYKCHQKRTFQFDARVVLISGSSGSGKSSILQAIVFALYGQMTHKTQCDVTIEFQNMQIRRTHKPSKLLLENSTGLFEGEVAQHEINKYFGHQFECSSYVPQQLNKNFLYLIPSEKLAVLESLLFSDFELNKHKKKCINEMKLAEKNYHILLGQKQVLATSIEHIDKPLECAFNNQRYFFLCNKKNVYERFVAKKNMLEQKIFLLEHSPKRPERATTFTRAQLEKHLKAVRILPFNWQSFLAHTIEGCQEAIDVYEEDIRIAEKAEKLKAEIARTNFDARAKEQVEKELQTIGGSDIFSCPSCGAVIGTSDCVVKEKYSQLLRKLNHLRTCESQYSILSAQLAEMANIPLETTDDLRHEQKQWQEYKKCAVLVSEWGKFVLDISTDLAEKELLLAVEEEKMQYQDEFADKELGRARKQLTQLIDKANEQNLHIWEEELSALLEQKHSFDNYSFKQAQYEKYLSKQRELEQTQTNLGVEEKKLHALGALKQLISETEMECLEKTMHDIVDIVNTYATRVFDSQIVVQISLFKETSARIDLSIFYKGIECTFSMLSGGEQARLNTCFTLAFANYFGAKILLFDECTSQLGQELSERVFTLIKEETSCPVIIVANQIVEGGFDQIIKLE